MALASCSRPRKQQAAPRETTFRTRDGVARGGQRRNELHRAQLRDLILTPNADVMRHSVEATSGRLLKPSGLQITKKAETRTSRNAGAARAGSLASDTRINLWRGRVETAAGASSPPKCAAQSARGRRPAVAPAKPLARAEDRARRAIPRARRSTARRASGLGRIRHCASASEHLAIVVRRSCSSARASFRHWSPAHAAWSNCATTMDWRDIAA